MKAISYWASRHIVYARILIVFIKLSLVVLAAYTAVLLTRLDIVLPYAWLSVTCLILTFAAIICYPSRQHKKRTYWRQKICDFTLPFCSFIIITAALNNIDSLPNITGAYASSIVKNPTAADIMASGKTRAQLTRKEKRILRHEFTRQLKNYALAKISNDQQKAENSWKVALAIIGFIGLTILLAGLVCELSCGGSDAAAVLVGLLGFAALIWGLVALLKRIRRGPPEKKDE